MDPIYMERGTSLWLTAADEGGITLPPAVAEARAAHKAADVAVKALARPAEPVNVTRLVDGGMDPKDAMAEADRSHQVIAAWRAEHDVLVTARSFKADRLNRAVVEHLDDLVLATRPVVTALVEEARPLVPKLDRFARGGHKAEDIVAKATAPELRAYQAIMTLQARLDAIHAAWAKVYMSPARVSRTGEVSYTPGVPGWHASETRREHFYWTEPRLVGNPRCNGQALSRSGAQAPISKSLLLVAAEPAEAGFRLAVMDDLKRRARLEGDTLRAARPPVNHRSL
jgi:hypothetical protein